MKSIESIVAFSFLILTACGRALQAAEAGPNAAGHWEGAIAVPPAPLTIQVDFTPGADQSWQGTIDIPAQGTHGFALKPVTVDGVAIMFGMAGVPGEPLFSGRLSDGGKIISGDFTQGGQKFPFKLERSARRAVAPVESLMGGKGMEGRWQGSLKPAPGVELRLALEISRSGSGATTAVLVSLDQGNARIPLTTLSDHAGVIHFEAAGIGGVYDGKLSADGSEIAGDWKQAGRSTPLLFTHDSAAARPDGAAAAKPAAVRNEAIPTMDFKWLVLSPIPVLPAGSPAQPDEDTQKKAFAADLLATLGGEAQIRAQLGGKCLVNGVELEWKAAKPVDDVVTLNSPEQKENYQIAYASTEFDVPADTQAWLGIGSDDGVRVWLNGVLVHEHWIGRAALVDDDVVKVALKAGRNRLLLKVQNMTGGWGFAGRLMDANAIAGRMVAAARSGDLAALKDLADRGFDVNARASDGLTPFLAARIWGQRDAADFLEKKGADTHASVPAPEALVDTLLAGRISGDGAGAAVLVARHGKILYAKGFGLADIERHVPVTVDTKFRIGSVTKQFTASGILRLQEAGKLKLTDTLAKFYPDFPRGGEVTLQRLLTHTSGIHSYTDSVGFIQTVTMPTTTAELVEAIKKYPFDFNPGVRWSYSNSGYYLLGAILEKVSGQEYGEFLRETFFTPLGMNATGEYRNSQPPDGAAVGYEYVDGHFKKALDWDMSRAGGAGSIYSTVKDLYLWNEAVFGGKVLGKDDLAAAFTPVVTEENKSDKSADGYGYGWGIGHFRGEREISHGGGLQGFLSNLLRFPEKDFTVVVLVNESPPKPRTDPFTLSHEIAEIYLGAELAPTVKAVPPEAKPVSDAALAAIVGRYDYRSAYMVVTREGNRVYAQLGGQPRFEIFPKSETEFFWKIVDAQVTFEKDLAGKVVAAIHHQGGQTLHAPRVEEVVGLKLEDARTDPLLGDYDFKPVGKMTISRTEGKMYGQLTGQPKLELGATSDTEFFVRMVNARVTFVKDADGKVTKAILHQGGQDVEMPRLPPP